MLDVETHDDICGDKTNSTVFAALSKEESESEANEGTQLARRECL